MQNIYLASVSLISSLAQSKEEHHNMMMENKSGVKTHKNKGFNGEDLSMGIISSLEDNRLENLLNLIFNDLEKNIKSNILFNKNTRFIISTTKAEMSCFPDDTFKNIVNIIEKKYNAENRIYIISNACISGVIAINSAADFIKYNFCDNCVVIGIDLLWDFINFGFQSLFAVSNEVCKPFDAKRNGISIGEAGACVVLSNNISIFNTFACRYISGSSSNDANHISGPSRTGEGLFRSINKTLNIAKTLPEEIDYISAHGTATIFNDEMESIALSRANLMKTPVNSLKAYFGHTFGAAGVLETGICILSMEYNTLYTSLGFEIIGTTHSINVISSHLKTKVNTILKTSSGFGGGNATLLIKRVEND